MIALDAMGGDFAPRVAVEGALIASKKGIPVSLFGDKKILISLLDNACSGWTKLPLSIVHCPDAIAMHQEPSKSVVGQKDSSLVRAISSVADGDNVAVVSAGNSGAILVAATLFLGRAPNVFRPAIGDFIPTRNGSLFCIDLGANTDPKAKYLLQFACMGHVYVKMTKNINFPKIALLSNGSEPYKGSVLVKQAYSLLEQSPLNFIGNVESRDIFNCDIDVLVCDGFVGNILLKALEGASGVMNDWLKEEVSSSWLTKFYLMIGGSLFKGLRNKIDYARMGGALLLGLRSPCVIAHGCSNGYAISQAILFAYQVAQEQFIDSFNTYVSDFTQSNGEHSSTIASKKLRSFSRLRHY